MGRINILDAQTANLIAAGEVVERPSSAVKEMIENSIDAGATSITLELKNGGRSLVRVTDNGSGFLREDVPKALLRHATSKIVCGDDIDGIKSLGFRGEALAAIGSVSKLEIITKSPAEDIGTHLVADENGVVMSDVGAPDGTTVIMRDIFYNTPARQKFLKRDATESASCVSAAERLALSHPEISFSVITDGERRFMTSGDGELYPAIYAVFGREFAKSLVETDYLLSGVRVYGYVTRPDGARGSRAMQTAFVNGRYVKSKTVQAALEEAFRSFIPRGRFPGCVLFVELDPELTDVNVHPAKTEIKFVSERDVFHAVYYGVKSALESEPEPEDRLLGALPTIEKPEKPETAAEPERPTFSSLPERETRTVAPERTVEPTARKLFRPTIGEDDVTPRMTDVILSDSAPISEEPEAQQTIVEEKPVWRVIGQAYDSYIFVETVENILIVDKHAAHERILYEQLSSKKELNVQSLLSGVPITLDRETVSLLLENSEFLAEKGFSIEEFGEGTVVVRTVPATLSRLDGLGAILEDFARGLSEGNGLTFAERCDRALFTVACKAALKARVKNSKEDDENVIKMLSENPSLRFCPHGRPFIKTLAKRELEKFFDR